MAKAKVEKSIKASGSAIKATLELIKSLQELDHWYLSGMEDFKPDELKIKLSEEDAETLRDLRKRLRKGLRCLREGLKAIAPIMESVASSEKKTLKDAMAEKAYV